MIGRLLCIVTLVAAGCSSQPTTAPPQPLAAQPDYAKPLPPGRSALRPASRMPDLAAAYRSRDALLLDAIDESLHWFAAPSSQQFFPFEGITHGRARASLTVMRELLEQSGNENEFVTDVQRMFLVYESVGYDGGGTVLFTGYYSPIFSASREPAAGFESPLYLRPEDLVTDPVTGEPRGRRLADGGVTSYPTRREIEDSGMLAGHELVWLENELDAYVVHVNGSAKLRLRDGSTMYVGYAGKTDRPYGSLGRALIKQGAVDQSGVNLAAIKKLFRQKPDVVRQAMMTNENYVFFTEYESGRWPSGSLGVPVTAERSLATDKKIYPRGGMVLVDTKAITYSGGQHPFKRFLLDQDTGGAIQAPGRADIFMGIGPGAEILAGSQYAEGKLYYLVLKPEYMPVDPAGSLVKR